MINFKANAYFKASANAKCCRQKGPTPSERILKGGVMDAGLIGVSVALASHGSAATPFCLLKPTKDDV